MSRSLTLGTLVVAASFLLGLAAPVAQEQDGTPEQTAEDQVVDPNQVADPETAVPGTTPTPEPPTEREEPPADEADPGWGDAADQAPSEKRQEAQADCVPERPPVSAMLGLGGSVAGDEGQPWGWIVMTVALAALAFAGIAFLRRHRRAPPGEDPKPRGALEIIATSVAIFGGVAGIVVAIFPGIGFEEDPPPEADMAVREVHARITRGEYARKTGAKRPRDAVDRREVGNVVWLEIHLKGYGGKRLHLQYGSYDPDRGGALLPGTAKPARLRLDDRDVQTIFAPIWIGYPKSVRFEAQFRLLEGRKVRQMASTGRMRGSNYRYACM